MDATKLLIIQFIGLCVFTNQIESDQGLRAILPRAGPQTGRGGGVVVAKLDKSQQMQASNLRTAAPAAPGKRANFVPPLSVEPHLAVIVFRSGSFDSVSGWPDPVPLPVGEGYEYIRLDGEQITIDVEGKNPSTAGKLPSLPSLGQCCPAMGHLRDEFKPGYSGAAAVFRLPEGIIQSCGANANSVKGRVDTRLLLNNDGSTIVIRGVKGETVRTLKLKTPDTLTVFVGNIPLMWVTTSHDQYHETGLPHYKVYYDMGQHDSANPTCNPITACIGQIDVPTCGIDQSVIRAAGGKPLKTDESPIGMIASSECSNSQWP